MIGFLLKKTFFDLWDNLFRIALVNLGFLASAAIPIFIPPLLQSLPIVGMLVFYIGILWCFVYLAAAGLSLKSVSDYGSFGAGDFFMQVKSAWPSGMVMAGVVFLMGLLFRVAIPFYLSLGSVIGLLLGAMIFWTILLGILALQFFLASRARLGTKIPKILKKCVLIFFDNPLFCIFSFMFCLVMLVLSVFLAFLFPGPAGILLYLDEALRLRLLKYDWLEVHSDANRRKIPWDVLLIEEREKTGSRSFRSFIFPWKD
ncbi:MAG: hypothetical protein LBU25_08305 [Treponema sp.]|jgi:hypothetical protein|nr:hypothetical protein [Treponema sp.]